MTTIDLSVFFEMYRNYLNKCLYFLIIYFPCINAVPGKVSIITLPYSNVTKMKFKQRWKQFPADRKVFFTENLSKVFDYLSHEFLIAKLAANVCSRSALKLMYNCRFDRKQRTKISTFYSSWQDILSGIPQGLILGPQSGQIYFSAPS